MIDGFQILEYLKEQYESQGSISSVDFNGESLLFINHPDLIQEVLLKKHKIYHKSGLYDEMKFAFGNGLLTLPDGSKWLQNRRLAQPAFNKVNLLAMKPKIEQLTDDLIVELNKNPDSSSLDIHKEYIFLTINVICHVILGMKPTREESEIVMKNLPYVSKMMNIRVLHPKPLSLDTDTPSILRYKKSLMSIKSILMQHIRNQTLSREEGTLVGEELLTLLINSKDENGTYLSEQELLEEAMTQFLAGNETVANSLAYASYFLAKYPESQEEIYQSCLQEKEWWEYEALIYFIYEAIRLYPAIPILSKVAMEDNTLGGKFISKGTNVIVSPFVLHRTEDFWKNAMDFIPDRFNVLDLKKNRFSYIPFGEGARICIGRQMAIMESVLIMRKMLLNFKFELNDRSNPDFFIAIALHTKAGMNLTIKKRSSC